MEAVTTKERPGERQNEGVRAITGDREADKCEGEMVNEVVHKEMAKLRMWGMEGGLLKR